MSGDLREKITFGEFELDLARRRLTNANGYGGHGNEGSEEVRLNARAFDLLAFFVANAGRTVTKDEIMNAVWKDSFVEDANLAVQVSALRKALSDSKDSPRFLVTIPGKGYEFIAPVNIAHTHSPTIPAAGTPLEDRVKTRRTYTVIFAALVSVAAAAILIAIVIGIFLFRSNSNATNVADATIPRQQITRLTTNGQVSAIATTSDGQYLVFAQRESGGESLWLRQIETGSQTRVGEARELEYLGLAMSPKDNAIYASVFLQNRSESQLWKIPFLGGPPQEIANVHSNAAVAFSPDGSRISYIETAGDDTYLAVADADGNAERMLIHAKGDVRGFRSWGVDPVSWSPDGRSIAAAFYESSGDERTGILIVDAADATERPLYLPRGKHPESVVWVDADKIAFIAHEDQWASQIWTASVKSGEVRQITNNLQKYNWLVKGNSDGALITTDLNAVSTLYSAEITADGNAASPQQLYRELYRESSYILNVDQTPNGQIFFTSRASGQFEIWRINKDGSGLVQLTNGANVVYGMEVLPSGTGLLFSAERDGKNSLWTADIDGKDLRIVPAAINPTYPDAAADGTILYQNGDRLIQRLLPGDSAPTDLARGQKPAISPDGKRFAYFTMKDGAWRVIVAAIDTGATLHEIDPPEFVSERRLRWHPSGESLSILFKRGDELKLMLLPIDGSKPRIVENLGRGKPNHFAWSADGKSIVYSATEETSDALLISASR